MIKNICVLVMMINPSIVGVELRLKTSLAFDQVYKNCQEFSRLEAKLSFLHKNILSDTASNLNS